MIKTILLLALSICLIACEAKSPSVTTISFPELDWIDLTHNFDENTVYWPTAEDFVLDTVYEGMTDKGYYYSAYQYCSAEHGGTHMDAPIHFAANRQAVDEIPLESLIGEAVVIDVSKKALADPDYQINITDFEYWESENGTIPERSIVLVYTGYSRYWPDKVKYMGTAEKGQEAVVNLHFPGLHPDAATWLKEKNIRAFGLDTPSLDYGQSTHYETHQILNEQNIPGFENLANLDQLPPKGSFIVALPMKIKGGSGAPLRIIAGLKKG